MTPPLILSYSSILLRPRSSVLILLCVSSYCCMCPHTAMCVSSYYCVVATRQHTSAYVSIRQHTSACVCPHTTASSLPVSISQHTSAYVSIRQHTSACVCPHTTASSLPVSIRQHVCVFILLRRRYRTDDPIRLSAHPMQRRMLTYADVC